MKHNKLATIAIAGLLCAIGIIIPTFSPVKIVLEPASFTLASHVALFMAMFISPSVALAVEAGTTLGFVLAGFAPVVVLRAASQVLFVVLGALWLARHPGGVSSPGRMFLFGLATGAVHGVCEADVVTLFWFSGAVSGSFLTVVVGLVGFGTLVHSMVDLAIALAIWAPVSRTARIPLAYRPAAAAGR